MAYESSRAYESSNVIFTVSGGIIPREQNKIRFATLAIISLPTFDSESAPLTTTILGVIYLMLHSHMVYIYITQVFKRSCTLTCDRLSSIWPIFIVKLLSHCGWFVWDRVSRLRTFRHISSRYSRRDFGVEIPASEMKYLSHAENGREWQRATHVESRCTKKKQQEVYVVYVKHLKLKLKFGPFLKRRTFT